MPSPTGSAQPREVAAAGAVVLGPRRQVLLVHRPKYDDWSFPKGKVDRGEHVLTAAAREVGEETGLRVRLGVSLPGQRYPIAAGVKAVHYWLARPVGDRDVSRFEPNEEIDQVRWVDAAQAPSLLSYARDTQTLRQALEMPRKTRTLVVMRHGVAQSRRTFRGRDDRRRPLLAAGRREAEALVPLLAAYGVRRVLCSSSTRCLETVAPYARTLGRPVDGRDDLSEEGATRRRVEELMRGVVGDLHATPALRASTLVCSHRPVLPWVGAALGIQDLQLEKGELLVVHLAGRRPLQCERHLPV